MLQNSSVAPRPSGGFNSGMGSFGEHMDENAMKQASQQKALTQQAADPATMAQKAVQQQAAQQQQAPPRELGSITDELIARPTTDIVKELASVVKDFFSLNSWLGITPAEKDSQEQAKQKQMLQRYNSMNQEQQALVRKRFQEETQRKRMEKEQEERRKQMEAQQKSQSIELPSSPKKGAEGPGGNRKKKAVTKLQNDRKQLGGPQSAN